MSEVSRELLIRLPVDQEVYAEQVASGDVVQDATVATEIVAFDQDRDTYQLEGAIVFAAYVQKASSGEVVHVHQRLPFLLRVPTSAQQAGVLNVKSRLAGVELTVSGDAWLHLGGWLEVHGLNGSKGYLFRCGGQEVQEAYGSEAGLGSAGLPVDTVETEAAFEAALRGEEAEVSGETTPPKSALEAVSEARGGAEPLQPSGEGEEEGPSSLQRDLAAFDRLLPDTTPADTPVEAETTSPAVDGSNWASVAGSHVVPVASFEFVHQADDVVFDAEDRAGAPGSSDEAPRAVEEPEIVEQVRAEAQDEGVVEEESSIVAEPNSAEPNSAEPNSAEPNSAEPNSAEPNSAEPKISFFASGADERTEAVVQQESKVEEQALDEVPASPRDEDAARHESEAPKPQNKKLWSFVDFNAPEPRHTLRFVIVLEHETLEAVAERCGCLPSELERANPWLQGQPEPGTALLVPERRVTIQKVVTLN
ncbi:hypothetical protein [Alicyclobacillus fructus]|uniref:hypothetical protein n=1 Tax=Alicyclobacillus fructus TaxID=2816082 RepID=UPI001A900E55|nr:hypothetical protein [Alicyclobacillus fructus]